MFRSRPGWWAVGLALSLAFAASAQTPGVVTTLPRPASAVQPPYEPLPSPTPESVPPPPGSFQMSAPPITYPNIPSPESFDLYPRAAWRSNRWISADLPGVLLLFPRFQQSIYEAVQVGSAYGALVALPSAPLRVTATPLVNLRFDVPNMGEVELGYRFALSDGTGTLVGLDPMGTATLRSRLDMHVVDATFSRHDFVARGSFGELLFQDPYYNDASGVPLWTLAWDIGGRFVNFYWDSQAAGPTIERKVSNYFIGGGAKVGLTLSVLMAQLGVSMFSRFEVASVMGNVQQRFSESNVDLTGAVVGFGYAERSQTQAVPVVTAHVGIRRDNPASRWGNWMAGYQYEHWFAIGSADGSFGDYLSHGLFLKWLVNF